MNAKKTTRSSSDESRPERFKQMARELGADESPEAFDRTLKRIAPGKPAPAPKKKPARAK
jgi:hypothetical protein